MDGWMMDPKLSAQESKSVTKIVVGLCMAFFLVILGIAFLNNKVESEKEKTSPPVSVETQTEK